MINDGSHSYTYDAEGNLVKVDSGNTATYTYDGLNNRVRIDRGPNWAQEYIFNPLGQRVSDWDPVNHWEQAGRAYWGALPVSLYDGGTTQFEHQDWVGTERARTYVNGTIAGTYTSLPFGDGYSFSGTDWTTNHFAGLDHDSASDDHAQFRQYSNMAGRWMSPDPYAGSYDFSNPQSFNRYAYVENAPLSYTDPLGLAHFYIDEDGCVDFTWSSTTYDSSTGQWTVQDNQTTLSCPGSTSDGGLLGTLLSGGFIGGGGGGGGGGSAPNNGPQKPGFWSCTFTGNVGASWGETALDAVGIIPFGGNGVKSVQLASGIVAGSISAYKHSMTGAGLSAGGLVLTAAEDSGAKLALNGVEMIPVAGNVVSAVATGVDIFGSDGLIAAYKGCMAGTHP
jgi:RHS repeat-associated protein